MIPKPVQNTGALGFLTDLSWSRSLLWIIGLVICFSIGFSLAIEHYLFVLGLTAILLAFLILLFPYFGLLIFLGLTYIRPQDYVPAVEGKPIVLAVMLLTLGSFLTRIVILRQREFVRSPQSYLMLGLLIAGIGSTIGTVHLTYIKDSFFELLKLVFLYFLIVNLIDTHRKLSICFYCLLLLTISIAILGILQYYGIDVTKAGMIEAQERGGVGRIRGVGIFDNPNYLAYCVIFMLPAAIYLLYYLRSVAGKLFSISVVCLLIYCIYLTKSRGGYLCVTLVLSLLPFLYKDRKLKLLGLFALLVAIFIVIRLFPFLGVVGHYEEDPSAMGRITAWQEGFKMLMAFPLLGFGYGKWHDWHHRSAHNSFVQVAGELGIVGLFVWIGLLYWCYRYLTAIIQNHSPTNSRRSVIYAKSLMGTLLAYVFASFLANIGYFLLLYIFLSLIAAAGRIYIPRDKLQELDRMRGWDLCIIGMIEVSVITAWGIFCALQ